MTCLTGNEDCEVLLKFSNITLIFSHRRHMGWAYNFRLLLHNFMWSHHKNPLLRILY